MTNDTTPQPDAELEEIINYLDSGTVDYPGKRETARIALTKWANRRTAVVLNRIWDEVLARGGEGPITSIINDELKALRPKEDGK